MKRLRKNLLQHWIATKPKRTSPMKHTMKQSVDEKAKKEFAATLDSHKAKAHESHEAYNEAIRRCKQTWGEISELEQNPNFENGDRLAQLKESFTN